MSISISFDKLAVLGSEKRLPLSVLDLDENSHIHGEMKFQIGNRLFPIDGFWGIEDVCFNDWIQEFDGMIKIFDSAKEAVYKIDSSEPGTDAYLFEKEENILFLSLVNSEANTTTPGWEAHPLDIEWQRVELNYQEFKKQSLLFKELFFSEVRKAAPEIAEKWIEDLFAEHPYWAKYRERFPERFE